MNKPIILTDALCENMLNNLPGMFYRQVFDTKWKMTFISEGVERLTGYTTEELLNSNKKDFKSLIYKEDQEWLSKKVDFFLESKISCNNEYRIVCKNKRVKWVQEIANGIYNNQGALEFIEGYIQDITTEHELRDTTFLLNAYQKAIDESSAICITDFSGKIIYANKKICEYTQYSQKELVGNTHRIVNSGYHSNEFFETMWHTIKSGKVWRGEVRNKKKDGTLYWLDVVITPVCNEDGEIVQFLSIRNLITDKKATEASLFEYKDAFDNSPDQIFLINVNTMLFVNANDIALKELGYSKKELLKMGPQHIKPLYTKQNLKVKFEKIIESNNKKGRIVTKHKTKNGELIDVAINIRGFDNPEKQHLVVAIARNITEQKKQEKEREQLLADLQDKLEQNVEYSYNISHHLRAPVANILGLCQLLEYKVNKEEFAEIKNGLVISSKNIDRILKDLSTILNSKTTFVDTTEKIYLTDLVNSILGEYSSAFVEKSIELYIDIDEKANEVISNKRYLLSILKELINNALKFADHSRPLLLKIIAQKSKLGTTINIVDNGIGIDMKTNLKDLFKLYKTFSIDKSGKGLGLHLVKNRINALDAEIKIESELGKGTKVSLII